MKQPNPIQTKVCACGKDSDCEDGDCFEALTAVMQILEENHQLKVNLSNIEQYCDETHRRWEGIEDDYRRKLDYIARDMEEYKKR